MVEAFLKYMLEKRDGIIEGDGETYFTFKSTLCGLDKFGQEMMRFECEARISETLEYDFELVVVYKSNIGWYCIGETSIGQLSLFKILAHFS